MSAVILCEKGGQYSINTYSQLQHAAMLYAKNLLVATYMIATDWGPTGTSSQRPVTSHFNAGTGTRAGLFVIG